MLPGFTRVARIFSTRAERKNSQLQDELDTAHADLMNHIDLIEQNINAIRQQLLEQIPLFVDFTPQHTPQTLHQFQQIVLLLNDLLAQENGVAPGVPHSLSPEELEQFQLDNSLHNKNNLARLRNSTITVTTMPLEPFYGADGKPIPGFPETGASIKKLKRKEINNLLQALDLPVDGALADRRQRFMKYIGFTMLLY